jgi:nucleoid-associated protein
MAGSDDFMGFSSAAVEHLTNLMEESNLTTGGHALFCHYQQGLTDYLIIALVQETEAVTMTEELHLMTVKRLDLDHIRLAARINLSEWKNNPQSRQYISYIKGKQGRKVSEYFRDFIGCQEGIDGPGETRTLLKAFSDFVESEDLDENSAREKTETLVSYAMAQAKLGEPITLDELSEVLNNDQPKAFAEFIEDKDYGLSASIPPDKKTLNKFRRFTGRADVLSISFEQHLLGSKVEFDEAGGTLTLRGLPRQLTDQLKRAVA